jgi:hypothetical protein
MDQTTHNAEYLQLTLSCHGTRARVQIISFWHRLTDQVMHQVGRTVADHSPNGTH